MSVKRKVEVYLDEETFERYAAHAHAVSLSLEALMAEIVNDYLVDDSITDEVLGREDAPQPPISLEEMRRRLAT